MTHRIAEDVVCLKLLKEQKHDQGLRRYVQIMRPIPEPHFDVRRSQVPLPRQAPSAMTRVVVLLENASRGHQRGVGKAARRGLSDKLRPIRCGEYVHSELKGSALETKISFRTWRSRKEGSRRVGSDNFGRSSRIPPKSSYP